MTVNYFETINILLFNNSFMIHSMIIITVIPYPNFFAFGFKFKTGFHITITTQHLPLAEKNYCL